MRRTSTNETIVDVSTFNGIFHIRWLTMKGRLLLMCLGIPGGIGMAAYASATYLDASNSGDWYAPHLNAIIFVTGLLLPFGSIRVIFQKPGFVFTGVRMGLNGWELKIG